MTLKVRDLSDFVQFDEINRLLTLVLPVQTEPMLYEITVTLNNGLATRDYTLKINVLKLYAPYFEE